MSIILPCLGRGILELRNLNSSWSADRQSAAKAAAEGWRAERAGALDAAAKAYENALEQIHQGFGGGATGLRSSQTRADRPGRYGMNASAQNALTWARHRHVAVLTAAGRFADAADALEHSLLRQPDAATALHHAAMLACAGDDHAACHHFEEAVAALMLPDGPPTDNEPNNSVSQAVNRGLKLLNKGDYDAASTALGQAAEIVDILLTAHAAWAAADYRMRGGLDASLHLTHSMTALAELDDIILHHLARTRLAECVAGTLRHRNLGDGLALAASGRQRVAELLAGQRQALAAVAIGHEHHAELHYRLGLLARAAGDAPAAIRSWKRVLGIVPGHPATAARLAALLASEGKPLDAMNILLEASQPSPDVLLTCHALSVAAADPATMNATLARMDRNIKMDTTDLRANIAFTLAAMGVTDAHCSAWKNPFAHAAPL